MKNKGHKSSNIFQTLKGSGAWQSKDGSKPMIKDVGIKSPLNMNQSLGKHYLSKGSDGNSPLNLGLGTAIGGAYLAKKAVKKGVELVGKAKQAYSDYKSGQKTRVESETKKKNQSDNQTKLNNASGKKMKDLAHGSQERYDEYEKRKWKHDDTSKVAKKEDKPAEVTPPAETTTAPTAKEVKVKTDNVSKAKANVQSERGKKVTAKADLAKAAGKDKKAARLEKRAARIAKRKEKGTGVGNLIRKGVAAVKGKKGAAKGAAVAAQVSANEEKKNSAAAMKKSPAKLAAAAAKGAAKAGKKAGAMAAKKSPAKKSLVGKQGNLPDHLVAKIKAAPGKMKYKK